MQPGMDSKVPSGHVVVSVSAIIVVFCLISVQTLIIVYVGVGSQAQDPNTSVDSSLAGLPLRRGVAQPELQTIPAEPAAGRQALRTSKYDKCYMGGILNAKTITALQSGTAEPPAISHMYGLDQRMLPAFFTPFSELLCASGSDKQTHRFGHMYSEYLDPMRLQQESVNMLEIGLRDGDSLNLWLSAFGKGKIYGIDPMFSDVVRNVKATEALQESRIKIFKGDQENVTLLQEFTARVQSEVGQLDFIVDDGGHTMSQQITSFTHLFPLVRPGGLYFIEDLLTSYWKKKCHKYYNGQPYCYGGGPPGAKNTTIDLMKNLIDAMNADFMEDHPYKEGFGTGIYEVNPVDRLVGSVHCWRTMCVIRRKYEGSFF